MMAIGGLNSFLFFHPLSSRTSENCCSLFSLQIRNFSQVHSCKNFSEKLFCAPLTFSTTPNSKFYLWTWWSFSIIYKCASQEFHIKRVRIIPICISTGQTEGWWSHFPLKCLCVCQRDAFLIAQQKKEQQQLLVVGHKQAIEDFPCCPLLLINLLSVNECAVQAEQMMVSGRCLDIRYRGLTIHFKTFRVRKRECVHVWIIVRRHKTLPPPFKAK